MIRSAAPSQPARHGSLYEKVRLARLWLPISIVGVVLLYQVVVVPTGGASFRFWAQLLFYSILGPLATFLTLNWIAREVRLREQAQDDLARLFEELRSSHELLGAIQDVTARFAAAPDLEATVDAAARGVANVTGARSVSLVVGPMEIRATHGVGMKPALEKDAMARDQRLRGEAQAGRLGAVEETFEAEGETKRFVLGRPLAWGGRPEGSLHAYYDAPPDARRREAFSILASQFSAAAEATRLRMRDLITLVEVDRSIRAEGNLEKLLDTVLNQMMARVAAPTGGVFVADEEQVLRLRSYVGLEPGATPSSWRVGEGIVGRAAQGREPQILPRLSDEERAAAGPLLRKAGSAVALPMTADERLLGVIVLTHPAPGHFDPAAIPFLGLLASQVGLAVRNATAYLQSEELAIAEERARIAREIHDGVAQMLAFSALKLDLVARLLERDPAKAALELDQARDTIRETIREVRRSIFALRPVDLERHGFVETVRRYAADFGQQNDVRVRVDIDAQPELSVKSEAVLFRIFQEAMHNVAKHARARLVEVHVGTDDGGMAFVQVRDDGAGFELASVRDRVTSAGGLGLRQMRERVEARGGTLVIDAHPGGGTCVRAAVPA